MNPKSWLALLVFISICFSSAESCAGDLPAADSSQLVQLNRQAYKIYLSDPDSSIALAKHSLTISKWPNIIANSYYILSKAYWAKANYRQSLDYGFKALEVLERGIDHRLHGKTLLGLSRTMVDLQNFQQGKRFLLKARKIATDHNDQDLLGETFRELSLLLIESKQYDSALFFAEEALRIFEASRDTLNVSILYGRKAKIYFHKKDYRNSNLYNRRSLLFDSLIGNKRALGITYYQTALDAIHLNQFDSAIYWLQRSIPLSQRMRNLSTLVKVHSLLGDIYNEQKKPQLAIKQYKKASQYKDSLYRGERNGQIQEMLASYDLKGKEARIEQLSSDNRLKDEQVTAQRWYAGFLLALVFGLILSVFFLYRYRKLQERTNEQLALKNKAIEQQKEEIQSQAETLQDLNTLKSKLFSVISHDLRGPMATLHSLLDLLSRKQLTPEEFISVADKLKNNLGVTQRTMENLLNWSLSQMEGIRTDPKIVNVKDTIDDACTLMEEVAIRKNVQFENTIDDSLLVKADADQLQLILRNLIHNAIKFSKPYHNIYVTASRDDEYCLISVKDKGIGMTKAEIETVEAARNHFSKTGTMQEKGTGLGLLLCKEFIKLNGGEIRIKSSLNQGTEVLFTVPLALN